MFALAKAFWLCCLCLSLLWRPPFAVAGAGEEPVATVVAVRGMVTASNAKGAVRPLQRQDPIMLLDTIRTGEGGRIQCLFNDQTLVSLGQQGELKVKDFSWQAAAKNGGMKLEINDGAFKVLGGLITKHAPQNFETQTLPASIGIRGSSFAGEVRGDQLKVVFLGGKGVFVANAVGKVEISMPMFGTQVSSGGAPGEPSLWRGEALESLEKSLGSQLGPVSEGQVIINQSDNRGAGNLAVGVGNRANLGSVTVEQGRLQGVIVNQADNRNAVNAAIGEGNTANLGAVDLKETSLEGALINQGENQGASNIAIGVGNTANTGSVRVR